MDNQQPVSTQPTAKSKTSVSDLQNIAIANDPSRDPNLGVGEMMNAKMGGNTDQVAEYLGAMHPDKHFIKHNDGIFVVNKEDFDSIQNDGDKASLVNAGRAIPIDKSSFAGPVADLASSVLPGILSIGGGTIGAGVGTPGTPAAMLAGGMTGAGLGAGVGEGINQILASQFMKRALAEKKASQDTSIDMSDLNKKRIALQALFGVLGEGAGRGLGYVASKAAPEAMERIGEGLATKYIPGGKPEMLPLGSVDVNINKLLMGNKGQINAETQKMAEQFRPEIEKLFQAARNPSAPELTIGGVNVKNIPGVAEVIEKARAQGVPENRILEMLQAPGHGVKTDLTSTQLRMMREIERNPELTSQEALELISDPTYLESKVSSIQNRLTGGRASGMSYEDIAKTLKPKQLIFLQEMLAKRQPAMGLNTDALKKLVAQMGDIQGSLSLSTNHPSLKGELPSMMNQFVAPKNYQNVGSQFVGRAVAQQGPPVYRYVRDESKNLTQALLNALSNTAK